jgi:predicted MPP superfamily phosphohydrolase
MSQVNITTFSDTHGSIPEIEPCDILIIAGDILPWNHDPTYNGILAFDKWAHEQPADLIVYTPGNHDIGLDAYDPSSPRLINLCHRNAKFKVLTLSGFSWCYCPDMPELASVWATMTYDLATIEHHVNLIRPADILVSHSPPRGFLDLIGDRNIGCPKLLDFCFEHKVKYLVSGHTHECGGQPRQLTQDNHTLTIINTAQTITHLTIDI